MKLLRELVPEQSEDEQERPAVAIGDSIYFRHPELGAHHGHVAGIGGDGVLVDDEDASEHRVVWKDILGHRKRAERKLTIVDRGEDGSIMVDERGKRVFVRGSLDDAVEPGALPDAPEAGGRETLRKAQVVRELAAAGFEPMIDYVRENFGDDFVYRQPVQAVAPHDDGALLASLERLRQDIGAQFQGLAAAIALLADKIGDTSGMQAAMLSALAEARKPQPVNVMLTDGMMGKAEPAVHVDVHVPEQLPPIVNVAPAPAPVVNVAPATVHVTVPESPAPVVNIEIPARRMVTDIERDRDGNIIRAVQSDRPEVVSQFEISAA